MVLVLTAGAMITTVTIFADYFIPIKDQNGNYDNLELDQDLNVGYG